MSSVILDETVILSEAKDFQTILSFSDELSRFSRMVWLKAMQLQLSPKHPRGPSFAHGYNPFSGVYRFRIKSFARLSQQLRGLNSINGICCGLRAPGAWISGGCGPPSHR